MPENTINTTTTTEQVVHSLPDFGHGRYTSLMCECYRDARRILNASPEFAEKWARDVASEIGRHNAMVSVTIGKPNKDGAVTIREASRIKGVPMTNNIALLRLVGQLNELQSASIHHGVLELNGMLLEFVQEQK